MVGHDRLLSHPHNLDCSHRYHLCHNQYHDRVECLDGVCSRVYEYVSLHLPSRSHLILELNGSR